MEEDILILAPAYKLNKEWAIFLATFLGGPLPGAFLMAENFRQLGEPEKVKWTWGIAIAVLVVLFGAFMFIPALSKLPSPSLPLIYLVATRLLLKQYQEPAIRRHIAEGGPVYSIGRALLVGLIGAAVLVGIIFGFYFWSISL